MPPPSKTQILHAYRHLWRGLHQAIQYSKPARYTVRDQLRLGFRKGDPAHFSQEKVDRTIEFLGYAARERGLEHKIVKNLLIIQWWAQRNAASHHIRNMAPKTNPEFRQSTILNYEMTVAMFNDSMGLCLR